LIETAEQRTSVWEYINPINVAKFAYTSPLGAGLYGTYRAMARGGGLTCPGFIPWGERGVDLRRASALWGTDGTFLSKIQGVARTGARGFVFGVRGIGAGTNQEAQEAMAIARKGLLGWKKVKSNQLVKAAGVEGWMGQQGMSIAPRAIREVLHSKSLWGVSGPGVVALTRAGMIRTAGLLNPVMNILLAAEVISFAAEATFKGIRATSEAINRMTEKAYNLELGGELTKGYLTTGAATERQRALQAIQGSHLSGRRFLGSEASLAHS